ncbi:hypothetical protein MMC19_004177 [Ptychographa xylographoides]|nr:hypothetical protein [Ptychographa xylographoides]
MSEPTIVVMVIRLLRHARKHWPAALGNISSMFITHVRGNETIDTTDKFVKMPERTSARLSLLYNRILTLLALPSSQHPYRAIPYHQRAQFNVISKMNDFEPPLAINVEGYRAVVVVQLAHRKTLKEREWAKMKAVSWPPWKEEKLGIDADIGVDSGISRADETLSRLKEGGYASRPWQSAAKILSGWDTDQSPTIQTRAIFQESVKSRHVRCLEAKFINSEADSDVWAARIRSTRTLNESWACFVAYKDRNLSASIAVYYAMIEKLVFDTKRNRKESQGHSSQLLGQSTNISLPEWSGDSKEVSADPKDPRDTIYVRTPPPSLDDFFQTMIADGLVPSGRCLSFLISHAGTKSVGVKYLTSSNLPPGTISTLLGRGIPKSQDIHDLLKTLPEYMFASYIRFLCRFGSSTLVQDTRNSRNRESTKERRDLEGNTLLLAFRLMYVLKPTYRPAWYSLLSALIRPRVKIREGTFGTNGHVEDMATWYATLRIIDQMKEIDLELDFEGFQKICIGFEKAFAASQQILAGLHQPLITEGDTSTLGHVAVNKTLDGWERNRLDAEEIISNGTTKLTSIFKRLVAGYNSVDKSGNRWNAKAAADLKRFSRTEQEILLPKLLEVPSPAELHAFIRALGLSRDHDNLLALAQWMAHFSPELKAVADELRNGSTLMRRCLIAMRVFLEGHWQYFTSADGLDDDQGMQRAPEIVIEKVFRIIKEVEGWGGLPTDEEVETYCQRARSDRKPYSP